MRVLARLATILPVFCGRAFWPDALYRVSGIWISVARESRRKESRRSGGPSLCASDDSMRWPALAAAAGTSGGAEPTIAEFADEYIPVRIELRNAKGELLGMGEFEYAVGTDAAERRRDTTTVEGVGTLDLPADAPNAYVTIWYGGLKYRTLVMADRQTIVTVVDRR